jgi:hypothetical protein
MRKLAITAALALVLTASAGAASTPRSVDGGGNNVLHPEWGQAGTPYVRVAPVNYADGISSLVNQSTRKLNPRYISNRIFNDTVVTIFSENAVSQMGWLWGQFVDHTLDLRVETSAEDQSFAFNSPAVDPLETFSNQTGWMQFNRTPAIDGTGTTTPRQQLNTVNSFIDAWNVYGGTLDRQEWLRDGPYDGDLSNNDAQLVLTNGYLPRADVRGSDPLTSPQMDLMGPLNGQPQNAIVAGDVRANENLGLTALQTLFAREHNRIASMVPQTLSEQTRFDIARRVVGAEEQWITYNEFLPAMGVDLPAYTGYAPTVDPSISNEFATVGFRGHSGVNGELQAIGKPTQWSAARLQSFEDQGIEVTTLADGQIQLTISMTLAFGNPALLQKVGLGALLKGLSANLGYRNDEQIDNKFRSILFQLPAPGTDPASCVGDAPPPGCFTDVQDLGAIDIQRGRDHGMPTYNQMRIAYGLAPATSYTQITGESTASFPSSGVSQTNPIDDPRILDFTELRDAQGNVIPSGSTTPAVVGIRRSTLAARLQAIYGRGNVGKVEAFVGMVSEPHLAGRELGQLQLAMWQKQFQALRDGDRFFYGNDTYLNTTVRNRYGIDYRHTLAELIALDSNSATQPNVFKVGG